MGLILGFSLLIAAEQSGRERTLNAHQLSRGPARPYEVIGISVITVMELAQAVYRADTAKRRNQRMLFIDELLSALPIYPINEPVAIHAAFTDTDARKHGNTIALAVLLIRATALDLGYESPPATTVTSR